MLLIVGVLCLPAVPVRFTHDASRDTLAGDALGRLVGVWVGVGEKKTGTFKAIGQSLLA